jgi:hypothetical protein
VIVHCSQYAGAASGAAANTLSIVLDLPDSFDGKQYYFAA